MARAITDNTNSKNDNLTVYPRGYVVDAAGVDPGTTVGEPMVQDMLQFFGKLMADANPSVTPNSLPDNETNGYQYFQAFINYVRNVLTATETANGTVEKATTAEAQAGTADKFIDAERLQDVTATTTRAGIIEKATSSEREAGTADKYVDAADLLVVTGGIFHRYYEIGDWDMDTSGSTTILHGLVSTKIIGISVIIRNDGDGSRISLFSENTSGAGGFAAINSTSISLQRITGGLFDSSSYSNTPYNRGWVILNVLP